MNQPTNPDNNPVILHSGSDSGARSFQIPEPVTAVSRDGASGEKCAANLLTGSAVSSSNSRPTHPISLNQPWKNDGSRYLAKGTAPENGVASQRRQTVLILNQNSSACAAEKCDSLLPLLQKSLPGDCILEESASRPPNRLSAVPDLILLRPTVGLAAKELIGSCKEKSTRASITCAGLYYQLRLLTWDTPLVTLYTPDEQKNRLAFPKSDDLGKSNFSQPYQRIVTQIRLGRCEFETVFRLRNAQS